MSVLLYGRPSYIQTFQRNASVFSRVIFPLHMFVLLYGRPSYIQTFQRNASVFSRVIFHLKSVNFLFCSVYIGWSAGFLVMRLFYLPGSFTLVRHLS